MRNNIQLLLFFFSLFLFPFQSNAKLVIADGGASGYLMKNNLSATTLAVAMEADMIKLDLLLTKDNEVIVYSSLYLEYGTNVADFFPDRAREDGHFYVLDFTIDEIRQLDLRDPNKLISTELLPRFTVSTFKEQLSLIQNLEQSLHRSIHIGIELKKIWFHRKEERDLTLSVLSILQQYGYTKQAERIFLFSYDVDELQRLSKKLLPQTQMPINLVQLIDTPEGSENMVEEWGEYNNYNYDWIFSNTGLHALTASVTAIALPESMFVDANGTLKLERFVKNAQKLGTMIFTFPVQNEEQTRVPFVRSFAEELEFFYFTVGVDGILTGFCQNASSFLDNRIAPLHPPSEEETPPPANNGKTDTPLHLTTLFSSEIRN